MRSLLGFAILLAACHGHGLPTESGAPCTDYANAVCNLRASCTGGASITRDYGDLATCVTRTALQCTASTGAPGSTKTTSAVEACAKAYAGFSCATYFDGGEPDACVFTGTRANGASCAFAAQCMSGFCSGTKVALCGTCADAPAAGASCATSSCGRDQACDERTSTCIVYGAAGASCNDDAQPCGFDLACPGGAGKNMGTCTAETGTTGDKCGTTSSAYCTESDGVTCQGAVGGRTCQAATFAGAGGVCGGSTPSGVVECKAGSCYGANGPVLAGMMGTCVANATDEAACDLVVGPACLAPARCVVGTAGGTSGKCMLPSASSCN